MDYININKTNSQPLHHQIYSSIKDAIQNKTLMPGDKLPTEDELCQCFNISRPVVRQAYNKLIEEEMIIRHKGKGTFVLNQKIKYTILENLSSLTDQIMMNNMHPTILEYLREEIMCPQEYCSFFNKQEPFKVIHLKRMYLGNNTPQIYVEAFLSLDIYKDMIEKLRFNETVRVYTKDNLNFEQLTYNRRLTAIKFPSEVCDYFNVGKNTVGFRIDSTNTLIDGTIADFTITYIKGLGTRMTLNYF